MYKKITFKLITLIIATIFGIGFSIPTFFNTSGAKITLGLDLQGGLHMLLGVETQEAIKSKVKSLASSVKYFADTEEVLIDELKVKDEQVNFVLLDKDEQAKLDKMLKEIQGLEIKQDNLNYSLSLTEIEKKATIEYAITQAVETIRNRLDQFGLAEPTVARQGEEKILVELPGIKTAQEEQRAKELIAKAAHLQLMALDEQKKDQVYKLSVAEAEQYGDIIYPDANDENQKYLLRSIPILDGAMLTDAKVGFDQNNQPVINFSLNSEGAKIFGDFTGKNVGNHLAIVLDGKVYSAPVIRERIGGGSGQISGGFSMQEARDVAIALRSGALPAPVKMLEKRSIGPSLGADSIKSSMIALISGFILVVGFMAIYYGYAGIIANLALVVNLLMIVATMALFGATLTLPGMAGIVLSIGMGVDANVIINERVRELLRQGVSIRASVDKGYANAMSAIVDSNITTLITSIVLYIYGSGPIKGFAITMGIGILASMITGIVGTHGIYHYVMHRIEKSQNIHRWFGIRVTKKGK